MHPLSDKWIRFIHLPHRHDFVPWMGHLIENEHFWMAVAWIILLLTLAFFATSPVY